MSNRLTFGSSAIYSASFSTDNGEAYTPPEAQVTYYLLSEDKTEVLDSGASSNTPHQQEEWSATVTLPATAPRPNRAPFLYLKWELTVGSKVIESKEVPLEVEFTVEEELTTGQYIYISNLDFYATLQLPQMAEDVTMSIVTETGVAAVPKMNVNFNSFKNGMYLYQFVGNQNVMQFVNAGAGAFPYNLVWEYTVDGMKRQQIDFMYAISGKMFALVNNLRMYLDKARNFDIDESLQWKDVELLHFSFSAIHRINSTPPSNFAWGPNSLPASMFYCWEKCAAHEALNALYLAEGYRVINFTGQATTLEVDRTPFIQTKMDEIGGWLETNLERTKKGAIRGGSSIGTLGLTVSSSSVFNSIAPPGFNESATKGLANRLGFLPYG